jgi:uncharacterized membrane protein YkvA (DUF1232 family)
MKMMVVEGWKQRARQLKTETYALYLAYKDSRTPWYARLCAALVVGYAFSPVDLIPDFIPVLGYLDDLVLVPLGVALVLQMIPRDVLAESRDRASKLMSEGKPTSRAAVVVIVAVWLLLAVMAVVAVARLLN